VAGVECHVETVCLDVDGVPGGAIVIDRMSWRSGQASPNCTVPPAATAASNLAA
jgi:hypothetical protein